MSILFSLQLLRSFKHYFISENEALTKSGKVTLIPLVPLHLSGDCTVEGRCLSVAEGLAPGL